MPTHARRRTCRSILGSSIASHLHSSRTSGEILGPEYCFRSSVAVGGVKVRQAESMNSVRSSPSVSAEERESVWPADAAASGRGSSIWVFSAEVCGEGGKDG
jgi:hypothetical protein